MTQAALSSVLVGGHEGIFFAEEVGSTNDIAADLGRKGAEAFTTIWANRQTKGRGRLGRVWQTYPGCGLAFSVILKTDSALLPLLISVCLHRALSAFLPAGSTDLCIKWPNDILLAGGKLAGILIESFPDGYGCRFYVAGIGLNVSTPEGGFQDESQTVALNEKTKIPVTRQKILAAILLELKKTLDETANNKDHAAELAYYKKHCATFGRQVTWKDGTNEVAGTATDITPDGYLVLQTDSGKVTCNVGDIIARQE